MKKSLTILLSLFVTALALILSGFSSAPEKRACSAEETKLPIIMYHSVLNSRSGTYIISEKQFESDLKALKQAGYTTVFPSEVVDYAEGKGTLPEKPVMLTFDDGHYNNLYYAVPLLKKYGMKASINVVGRFSEYTTVSGDSDNPNYSHLTWDEIACLTYSDEIEIGNHTWNMHNYHPRFGVSQKSGECEADYKKALFSDIGALQKKLFEITGKECISFAYPFGKYNDIAEKALLDMGIKITYTCNEGVSTVKKGRIESAYKLRRVNRSGSYCTETVLNKIKK